jgi:hypothetical protein
VGEAVSGEVDSVDRMPSDDPPRTTWRNYLGPVILTSRRRRWNGILLMAWIAAAVFAATTDRFEILWVPIVGIATSSLLLLRDRAGRGRSL